MSLRFSKKFQNDISLYEPIGTDRDGNEIVMLDVINSETPDFAEQLIHDADVIFCLDFNEPKRIEKLAPAVIASEGRKVMIDHHLNPADFCRVTMSYPEM